MAVERMRFGRRTFVGSVVGLACGAFQGCATLDLDDILPSIRPADMELDEGVRSLRAHLSPEDGAVLDELMWRSDLLIHIIPGTLPPKLSRGGESSLASSGFSKERCKHHPYAEGVQKRRNWDVIYDRSLAQEWAKQSGIPNPIEVILYHEIFGHVLRLLRNPEFLDPLDKDEELQDAFEDEARNIENYYRRYLGLPEVPRYLELPTP